MKIFLPTLLLLVLVPFVQGEDQLAFPGAEGWGRFAKGGRGGRVIEVTNLKPDGVGSFRAAVEAEGPRTVVFRISGTINMGGESIRITHPYLTIAGHTAPGGGVLIRNAQIILIKTHDVIVRHLRVRPGPDVPTPASSQTVTADGVEARNIIVDHCSFGWATDDTSGCWGARDTTYQWCLFSEGLNVGVPKSGIYGKAFVVGSGAENISILNNVMAHFKDRTPQASSHRIQIVNNLIYNVIGDSNVMPVTTPIDVALLNNYYLRGPDSGGKWSTTIRCIGKDWPGLKIKNFDPLAIQSRVLVKGNYQSLLRQDDSLPQHSLVYQGGGGLPLVDSGMADFPELDDLKAAKALPDILLAEAGARVPVLSQVDERVIKTIRSGTGSAKLKHPKEVGGYPNIPVVKRKSGYDTDRDGIPDRWEKANGLEPANSDDGKKDSGDGYTWLEKYLHQLAAWD